MSGRVCLLSLHEVWGRYVCVYIVARHGWSAGKDLGGEGASSREIISSIPPASRLVVSRARQVCPLLIFLILREETRAFTHSPEVSPSWSLKSLLLQDPALPAPIVFSFPC